jgi:hypothetical protein
MEVDGVVRCPSGVNSWLWAPFSRPRGVGKEGQRGEIDCTPGRDSCSTAAARSFVVVASVGCPES